MTKKDILINAACVAVGAAIGSAVTWYVLRDKCEEEEVVEFKPSLKDIPMGKELDPFSIQCETPPVSYTPGEAETVESVIAESIKVIDECGTIMASLNAGTTYTDYSDRKEGGSEEMAVDKPYVISPEEFDDYEDYNKVVLTYYADQVLADDYGNIVSDVENAVGHASLKTFGQYEEDTVFVRNDARRTDYEITRDLRNYSDVEDPYAGY